MYEYDDFNDDLNMDVVASELVGFPKKMLRLSHIRCGWYRYSIYKDKGKSHL